MIIFIIIIIITIYTFLSDTVLISHTQAHTHTHTIFIVWLILLIKETTVGKVQWRQECKVWTSNYSTECFWLGFTRNTPITKKIWKIEEYIFLEKNILKVLEVVSNCKLLQLIPLLSEEYKKFTKMQFKSPGKKRNWPRRVNAGSQRSKLHNELKFSLKEMELINEKITGMKHR